MGDNGDSDSPLQESLGDALIWSCHDFSQNGARLFCTSGFIGLVIPHLVRLAFGTSAHRFVAPAAALAGGTLLAAADLVARTAAAPRQLPVGAIMALLGVPMFLILLRRLEGPRA